MLRGACDDPFASIACWQTKKHRRAFGELCGTEEKMQRVIISGSVFVVFLHQFFCLFRSANIDSCSNYV